jgi:DNA-binding NtrC family response regulator
MFANAIHKASHRKNKPFMAINCAAMPDNLLLSQLFGHKKGSFTGAERDHIGFFKEADGGTLFLDEVGECGPEMQAKLLRALQPPANKGPCHRIFRPIGATKDDSSDVRIIAATNRDLLREIPNNKFREDLYYRLAVISLKLPPLCERRTDIPLLANALLAKINNAFRETEPAYQDKSLAKSAIAFIRSHTWRGNVRQLENALTQAAVMSVGDELKRSDLEAATAEHETQQARDVMGIPFDDGFSFDEHVKVIKRHLVERAMNETGGVISKAQRLLGMGRGRLAPIFEQLEIDPDKWKV